MSSTLSILFGFILIFLSYFLVIWGLDSIFFFISREKIPFLRNLKITGSLAGMGFLLSIVLMIAFSLSSVYLLAASVALICFGAYFALLKYLWKFNNFDAAVIATTLAIILNPAWLSLTGVI